VRERALLGARDCGIGALGQADAASLRETASEAWQERRRRSYLRGGDAADDGFRAGQSAQQQPSDMAYKVRELLVRRRTQTVDTLRSHLAEMGIVAAQARGKLVKLIAVVREAGNARLPEAVRLALEDLAGQIEALDARLARVDNEIVAEVRASEAGRRLTRILGVGPITTGALLAMVPDQPGRLGAALCNMAGLGAAAELKRRLGRIGKQGNRYLRTLLILGAANVLRFMCKNTAVSAWLAAFRERRPFKVVAVALAHKMARIVWP